MTNPDHPKPIVTADDLLTLLASLNRDNWYYALSARGTKILREAADLCGAGDADTLSRKQAINAIIENF